MSYSDYRQIIEMAVKAAAVECLTIRHGTAILQYRDAVGYDALALWLEDKSCVGEYFEAAYESVRESGLVEEVCDYLTDAING